MFSREIISESKANQIALTSKKWRDTAVLLTLNEDENDEDDVGLEEPVFGWGDKKAATLDWPAYLWWLG